MEKDWILLLREKHQTSLSIKDLTLIISGVQESMRAGDLESLTQALEVLNQDSSTVSLVCLLRSVYSARDSLPAWHRVLQNSRVWINSRGEVADKVLAGL